MSRSGRRGGLPLTSSRAAARCVTSVTRLTTTAHATKRSARSACVVLPNPKRSGFVGGDASYRVFGARHVPAMALVGRVGKVGRARQGQLRRLIPA